MDTLISHIKGQQLTIDKLLYQGFLGSRANPSTHPGAVGIIDIVYQKDDCTMGFVDYPEEGIGRAHTLPIHVHEGNIQVIMVVKKSVLMKISKLDNPLKVMDCIMYEGEVCVIRPFEAHRTIPLEAGARIAFINVPRELGFDPYQQGELSAQ